MTGDPAVSGLSQTGGRGLRKATGLLLHRHRPPPAGQREAPLCEQSRPVLIR